MEVVTVASETGALATGALEMVGDLTIEESEGLETLEVVDDFNFGWFHFRKVKRIKDQLFNIQLVLWCAFYYVQIPTKQFKTITKPDKKNSQMLIEAWLILHRTLT